MKGSPLIRALVLAGVMLALGWPLHVLTEKSEAVQEHAPAQTAESPSVAKIPVVLTFSRAARQVQLLHLGAVVWSKELPSLSEALELALPFPPEGLELGVKVEWGEPAAAALRIQMTTPEGTELERSVWGNASAEAIVPFP
jgi:hypothetical protein